MKKIITLVLAGLLAVALMAGCSHTGPEEPSSATAESSAADEGKDFAKAEDIPEGYSVLELKGLDFPVYGFVDKEGRTCYRAFSEKDGAFYEIEIDEKNGTYAVTKVAEKADPSKEEFGTPKAAQLASGSSVSGYKPVAGKEGLYEAEKPAIKPEYIFYGTYGKKGDEAFYEAEKDGTVKPGTMPEDSIKIIVPKKSEEETTSAKKEEESTTAAEQTKATEPETEEKPTTYAGEEEEPTTKHRHSYTSKVTKDSTCSEEGVRTYTCSCGESYTEPIAKKSHRYTSSTLNGVTTYTCTVCGDTYTSGKHEHSWQPVYRTDIITDQEAWDEHRMTCTDCHAEFGSAVYDEAQAMVEEHIAAGAATHPTGAWSHRTVHHDAVTHEEQVIDHYECQCGQLLATYG